MRRIVREDKTTVRSRYVSSPNPLKKETPKPWKATTPLRPVSQGVVSLWLFGL
uniref:Uncharacterized protein n=1 Tax=Elaeophora elaphi TaxID=1147741 RepID=A0A0R3RH43_9BILA